LAFRPKVHPNEKTVFATVFFCLWFSSHQPQGPDSVSKVTMEHAKTFLESSRSLFRRYKNLGEKALDQIPDEKLFWQFNEYSNSAATIVKHLSGNMMSRWTEFLSSDGEKTWRNRDGEFNNDLKSRDEMMLIWEKGWETLFISLEELVLADFDKTIYIENQPYTLIEAINRELTHYSSHVGQLIYLGKMLHSSPWQSLSIPKGQSELYKKRKFDQPKNEN